MPTTENNRQYVPNVGANVRLRLWSDYSERGLVEHIWSHFRVMDVNAAMPGIRRLATLQRLNGTREEGQPILVPIEAIEPPIGWKPRYTIHCAPDKVAQVLGWFARGIRVKVDHALDRLAGNCFMPADVDTAPTWGYAEADTVSPADCPAVFSVSAYVEQEFYMPKDKWLRRQYQKACRAQGWKVWNRNYGAHGYAWFRSKEVPVWDATDTQTNRIAPADWLAGNPDFHSDLARRFTPPLTPLDLLGNLDAEYFRTNETYGVKFEQDAIKNGQPIARWILNRAEYHLNGTISTSGNSTWMFDPESTGDPVNRKGDK